MASECWPLPCSLPCRGWACSTCGASATKAGSLSLDIPRITRAGKMRVRPKHCLGLAGPQCWTYSHGNRQTRTALFWYGQSSPAPVGGCTTTQLTPYFFFNCAKSAGPKFFQPLTDCVSSHHSSAKGGNMLTAPLSLFTSTV